VTTIPALRDAVEERFACVATLRQIVQVEQRRGDGSMWEGPVVSFSLTGHPLAEVAYTWYDPSPNSEGRRLHAVLHAGPVDSAETAVRLCMGGPRAAKEAS